MKKTKEQIVKIVEARLADRIIQWHVEGCECKDCMEHRLDKLVMFSDSQAYPQVLEVMEIERWQ